MHEDPITVLIIEDDEDEVFLIGEAIRDAGATDITLEAAETLQAGLNKLANKTYDAVLLDLSLPDSTGVEGVASVAQAAGKVPIIVCTGLNDETVGQDAIRCGAQDYLIKNPRLYGAIPRILRYTVERNRLIQMANKRVEQARKYTELLLSRVIAIADSGLGITDREGIFSLVNPALAKISGCAIGDLIGTRWTDLLVEQDRTAELHRYKKSFSHSENYDLKRLTIQRTHSGTIEVPMRSVLVEFDDDRLCRVLSFGSPPGSESSAEAVPHGNQLADNLKFGATNGSEKFVTSRLQFVGLQTVKAKLGDRWNLVADRVATVAEKMIARHLSSDDRFARNQAGDLVICFGQLSEEEARLKAQAIEQEICEKILEGDVGELADCELDSAILADLRTETYAVQIAPEEAGESLDLSALITSKIEEAVARARANTQNILAQVQKSCRCQMRDTHQRSGKGISLMMHDFDPDTRQWIGRLKTTANGRTETVAEIDSLSLGNAAQYIYDLGTAKVPLIAVGIDYSTLADKALFSKYTTICRSLDERATQSLVFNIKNLPRNIRQNELAAAATALRPFSRLQMIQLKTPDLGNLDLRRAAIPLVAIDYVHIFDSYVRDKLECRAHAGKIQKAGARIVVDRVTTQDCSFLFSDLGVDFVSYERLTSFSD